VRLGEEAVVTIVDSLADLVGCTLVHVDPVEASTVFWNGHRVLLRFREVDGALVPAGSYMASSPPTSLQDAALLAARVSYR
jgi:hypothetical protein